MGNNILAEKKDGIGWMRINRPEKLNALNLDTLKEAAQTLEDFRHDPDVRALIITGVGEKSFIAGMDIHEFASKTPLEQRELMRTTRIYQTVAKYPKPVIAMINGYCLGGGLELAMACDIRIASEKAKFGQPEIKIGIIPGGGGTQRLPRLVGEGQAMRLILSGEFIDAPEAHRIGLVELVFPADQLEAKTLELARKIAEKSPAILALAKESVKAAARYPLEEGLEYEASLFALCFSTKDKEEGVRAFLEKREPSWQGQ